MNKPLFLYIILALASSTADAQLQVNTAGHVGMGTSPRSDYAVSVYSTNGGLYCVSNETATDSSAIGITGIGHVPYHGMSFGVKGTSGGSFYDGKSFGVFGEASGGNTGQNYGVFGHLGPSCYGAAVYGSSDSSNSYGTYLSARYAGYFNGDVYVTGDFTLLGHVLYSNRNLELTGAAALEEGGNSVFSTRLRQLTPGTYYYEPADRTQEDEMSSTGKQAIAKQHYGLDADQLAEVFPDLVYDNPDGSKSINYIEMIPILVQAINELKAEVSELKQENASLAKARTVTSIEDAPATGVSGVTVAVPAGIRYAALYIYDLQGKKVEQTDVTFQAGQDVKVDTSRLTDGIYLCSLIADGKVVHTRRMIVGH